jgi:putative transposase
MEYNLHKASHSVYAIHLHIYLVTKYRYKVLTTPIVERIVQVVKGICQKHKCEVLEYGAEPDHLHLLIDLHPDNNISQLIMSFKSSTSRIVQSEFAEHYSQFYQDTALWGRQKFVVSCGGAPLGIVKTYVQNQAGTTE